MARLLVIPREEPTIPIYLDYWEARKVSTTHLLAYQFGGISDGA